MFTHDADLGPVDDDGVEVRFVQVVGITDAELAAAMAEGARTEGSGSSAAWLSRVHWSIDDEGELRVVIPLGEVDDVAQAFRRRLPFGRELLVADGQQSVSPPGLRGARAPRTAHRPARRARPRPCRD